MYEENSVDRWDQNNWMSTELVWLQLQDLAICTPRDVAFCPQLLLATTEAKIQLLGVRPPPFRSSHPSISRPSLVGARAPKVPGPRSICSPFLLLFTPRAITGQPPLPPYARCPGLRRVLRRRGDEHPPGMRTPFSSLPAIWLFVFGSGPILQVYYAY